jgi:hypothetical protein
MPRYGPNLHSTLHSLSPRAVPASTRAVPVPISRWYTVTARYIINSNLLINKLQTVFKRALQVSVPHEEAF